MGTALEISLGLTFTVVLLRTVLPESWRQRRPFSCDLCMTWWGIVAIVVLQGKFERAHLAAGGLTLLFLALRSYLKGDHGTSLEPPPPPTA